MIGGIIFSGNSIGFSPWRKKLRIRQHFQSKKSSGLTKTNQINIQCIMNYKIKGRQTIEERERERKREREAKKEAVGYLYIMPNDRHKYSISQLVDAYN